MQENQRVQLICEAVMYCQKVKQMGMPASSYSKALREPVFFLWEKHERQKVQAARYRSVASLSLNFGSGDIVYDHAIPFKILQDKLMELDQPNPGSVREILEHWSVACIITKEEDRLLSASKLKNSMPISWDQQSCLARYDEIGIEVIPNPDYIAR